MEDRYLNDSECIKRLIKEWETYGSIIVAFDYDHTVFDYHQKADTYPKVVDLLRRCAEAKFHLTVFTSCNDDRFPDIRKYLGENGIPFNSINETPDFIPFKGRKVYYNILLDDRAGLSAAYEILDTLLYHIRSVNATKGLDDIA